MDVRCSDDPTNHDSQPAQAALQPPQAASRANAAHGRGRTVGSGAVGMRAEEDLPADLAQVVSSLRFLDDAALWRAARSRLPTEVATQIEDLHLKRQFEGLTPNETQVLATLMRRYEQTMLVRAHATLLLKQRGHDVSQLVAAS